MGIGHHISNAVDQIGIGKSQLLQTFLGGAVLLGDGSELLLIGAVTKSVEKEWALSGTQSGTIVSMVFLGAMFGNLLSGWLGDIYGRRSPIIASYLGVAAFSFLSASATGFWSLVMYRFMVGLSFGVGLPTWNALGSEICPSINRPFLSGLGQGLFAVGEMYSCMLLWADDPDLKDLDWRRLVVLGGIPAVIMLVLSFFYLYESPHYLAIDGRRDAARATLTEMAETNGVEEVDIVLPDDTPESECTPESWGTNFKYLLSSNYLYTTLTMIWSTFTLNFLFYGTLYALPQVLVSGELPVSPAVNLMLASVAELFGFLLCMMIMGFWSRKTVLLIYLVVIMFATFAFVSSVHPFIIGKIAVAQTGWHTIAMIGLYMNKIAVAFGWTVVYLYLTEVYPTVVRVSGPALCIALGRLGSVLSPVLYEWSDDATGSYVTFFMAMCACCLINIVLVVFLPFETANIQLTGTFMEQEPTLEVSRDSEKKLSLKGSSDRYGAV